MCQAAHFSVKLFFRNIFIGTPISKDKNINASKVSQYYSIIYIQTHGKQDARKQH